MDKQKELEYLKDFAAGSPFDEELNRDLIRCLWTAYCLHYRMDVRTEWYDRDLKEIWATLDEVESETADWSDYDSFEMYMSRYLR